MNDRWIDRVRELSDFAQAAEPSHYIDLPADWSIGVSDVIDSTSEIASGRYKAVNLAGAGTISAVANALDGQLDLFIFAGDGARFAVPPDQADKTANALSRTAMWAKRDLNLNLRVGMMTVAAARAASFDVSVAFWRPSENVRYAMFAGDGMDWIESQLKKGAIGLSPSAAEDEPDLTGLSCQWGPIASRNGKILSLIVKPDPETTAVRFAHVISRVVSMLMRADCLNPVPIDGPEVRWPSQSLSYQSRVAGHGRSLSWRKVRVFWTAMLAWLVFRFDLRIGAFQPKRYRREIAENTDFRKYDDGLFATVDCSSDVIARLKAILDAASARRILRYGMHVQDEALMTCIAPSVQISHHMHFVDGANGGYAAAAQALQLLNANDTLANDSILRVKSG